MICGTCSVTAKASEEIAVANVKGENVMLDLP